MKLQLTLGAIRFALGLCAYSLSIPTTETAVATLP